MDSGDLSDLDSGTGSAQDQNLAAQFKAAFSDNMIGTDVTIQHYDAKMTLCHVTLCNMMPK